MKIFTFLLFFISASVLSAEVVLYCSDTEAVGFEPEENFTQKEFKERRFTIEVNFEEKSLVSQEIGFVNFADSPTICIENENYEYLACYNFFSNASVKINPKDLRFVRTFMYGEKDSIYITHGECEKF